MKLRKQWYVLFIVIAKVKVLFIWKKYIDNNQWMAYIRGNLVSCYNRECTYRWSRINVLYIVKLKDVQWRLCGLSMVCKNEVIWNMW